MSNYTGGTWRAEQRIRNNPRAGWCVVANDYIANIGPGEEGKEDTQKANAYLIAAAPELLTELEKAQTIMEQNGIALEGYESRSAAIKKARGEK